ncbi:hypothetical protein ACIBCM_04720 [Streptomyces sp. NPDC051018]|uniref:hypothetical protein n=1 Tax=Streptomyces sp. NPDC051018 TaxID=3365639 RepID=UPI003797F731
MTNIAAPVDTIARTCLYEGYVLWPYRRSALKNTQRWTFGGVFPEGPCADGLGERCETSTQVLYEHAGTGGAVTVRLRFLHVVDRTVEREGPGGPEAVDSLTVDGERHTAWQEATEREVLLRVAVPGDGGSVPVRIPAGSAGEDVLDASGRRAGRVVRSWSGLTGVLGVAVTPVGTGTHRLTVTARNTTSCPAPDREDRRSRERASAYAFASTHLILHSDDGRFLSPVDPPERLREASAACAHSGLWPVLAGEEGGGRTSSTVLASPITLYDFPAVAPESPGDLFDGTEIDQLLVLGVLSMPEEELAEARACDPLVRETLDRCAALGPADMGALHGAIREFRPVGAAGVRRTREGR